MSGCSGGARPARHRHLAATGLLLLALLCTAPLCCECTTMLSATAPAHKAGKAAARAARSGVKAASQSSLSAGAAVASATKRGSLRTWEAVRAAAKEDYEHNLVRAGLRQPPPTQQQLEQALHDHAGSAQAAAVAQSSAGLEAAIAQLQGGVQEVVAVQQQQQRVELLAEAVLPPPTQPSRDDSADTGTPPAAAAAGADGHPPTSQQKAGFRAAVTTALKVLLTHTAAFLLGWLLRGHAMQQPPQSLAAPPVTVTAATSNKPQQQAAAAASSSSSSSSHVARKRRQQAAAAPAGEQEQSLAAADAAAEDAAANQLLEEEDSYVEVVAEEEEEEDGTCAVSAGNAAGGRSSGGAVRYAGLASAMRVYSTKPAAAGAAVSPGGQLRRSTSNASSAGSSPGMTAASLKQHRPGGSSSKQLGIIVHRRPAAHQRRQQQQMQLAQQLRQMQLQHQNQQQQQLAPVQVINQAVIHNHNNLVLGSKAMEELVKPVVSVMRELQCSVAAVAHLGSRIMGWSAEKDAAQRLAEQQHLLDRAAHIGQLLALVLLGITALRVGRLWEAHQVCQAKVYEVGRFSHLAQRLTGTSSVAAGWRYLHCCASQLGLYAAGLFALYLLMRLSWQGGSRGSSSRPSNAWQLDLVVVKACVCSWLGAHVVHCLGGAWVPWLAAWLLWCGLQAALNVRVVGGWASSAVVVAVSLLLPLVMSVAPFHARPLMAQAWAMQAAPWLQRLPTLSLGVL